MMIKTIFARHHYKILFGAPIVFLLLISNINTSGAANNFSLRSVEGSFPLTGSSLSVVLSGRSNAPINAVGGTITFPRDLLSVTAIKTNGSAVDLWSEEPSFSNDLGLVTFSGGLLGDERILSGDTILTIEFLVLKTGKSVISMRDGMILAADGGGTNLLTGARPETIWARDPSSPSPDINGDGTLSIADANLLYLKTFRNYDKRYDLSGDKKVDWADIRFLNTLMRGQ